MKIDLWTETLNKFAAYRWRECYKCKRKYPDTILNIEGHIHHNMPFQCLDTKSCRRAQRKLQRV